MIEHIEIRNFQSLHDVSLDLSPFTVIIGPSSSGKSALTRALRTLIANARGNAFISHGEKVAAITARTDKGTVTLTRGKSADDNSYTVIPADESHPLYPSRTFKKLGGEVPQEVSEFLGIDPKDPIRFAGQFDKPYLLDDSPAEVARTLGALTNATILLEGARESNRRKLQTAQRLSTQRENLEGIKAKIPGYRALKGQAEALDAAEKLILEARSIQSEVDELGAAVESYALNARRVEVLEAQPEIVIPDEQELIDAVSAYSQFRKDLAEFVRANQAMEAAQQAAVSANEEQQAAEAGYSEALGGLAEGFNAYMREHRTPTGYGDKDLIMIDQAAELAARYVESFIR